jgi:hypothetical protein
VKFSTLRFPAKVVDKTGRRRVWPPKVSTSGESLRRAFCGFSPAYYSHALYAIWRPDIQVHATSAQYICRCYWLPPPQKSTKFLKLQWGAWGIGSHNWPLRTTRTAGGQRNCLGALITRDSLSFPCFMRHLEAEAENMTLRRATKLAILLAAFFEKKYEIRKVDVGGRSNRGLWLVGYFGKRRRLILAVRGGSQSSSNNVLYSN